MQRQWGLTDRNQMVFQASFSELLFYSEQVTQLEMIYLHKKTITISHIITLAQHFEILMKNTINTGYYELGWSEYIHFSYQLGTHFLKLYIHEVSAEGSVSILKYFIYLKISWDF